ncbi:nuclear transport factor 2 family protein [Luteimonas deserti]|uniref:Nuclear transport factor 2 family protein n=1 Tax=Luteimonas deserti TaxID=2752306 RepID=A0A7Z0QQM6_9GAMM|nr:nuclear transport factor 2 family protein [Luteimonas deserti]NYZ62027.1 nuclear transport factor 2 family protein [Luteimonas deserti]
MTPTTQRHLQSAKAYLEREGRGDLTVVDELMSEDIVMTIVSGRSPHTVHAIPWGGVHRGREAAKNFLRRLLAGQISSVDKIDRWVADEDTVVAFAMQQASSPITGRSGEWELAIRFDFEGDLISHYWVYEDSFSAVVMHSVGGELLMRDSEGTRSAPVDAHITSTP